MVFMVWRYTVEYKRTIPSAEKNASKPLVCPCQALHNYLDLRKHSPSNPWFSFMDGSPITGQYFTQQLLSTLVIWTYNIMWLIVFESVQQQQPQLWVFPNYKSKAWVDGNPALSRNTSGFQLCGFNRYFFLCISNPSVLIIIVFKAM